MKSTKMKEITKRHIERHEIKHEQLCPIGQTLAMYGLVRFIEHITNCKQCKSKNNG